MSQTVSGILKLYPSFRGEVGLAIARSRKSHCTVKETPLHGQGIATIMLGNCRDCLNVLCSANVRIHEATHNTLPLLDRMRPRTVSELHYLSAKGARTGCRFLSGLSSLSSQSNKGVPVQDVQSRLGLCDGPAVDHGLIDADNPTALPTQTDVDS